MRHKVLKDRGPHSENINAELKEEQKVIELEGDKTLQDTDWR